MRCLIFESKFSATLLGEINTEEMCLDTAITLNSLQNINTLNKKFVN